MQFLDPSIVKKILSDSQTGEWWADKIYLIVAIKNANNGEVELGVDDVKE